MEVMGVHTQIQVTHLLEPLEALGRWYAVELGEEDPLGGGLLIAEPDGGPWFVGDMVYTGFTGAGGRTG